MAHKIAILGTGYVGLVSGVGLADFGNEVSCTDIDTKKINLLKKGIIPIYEPGLKEYLERNCRERRLQFQEDVEKAIKGNDIFFLAVGTPSKDDGDVNLDFLWKAVDMIARYGRGNELIVTKSTVSVGTNRQIKKYLDEIKPQSHFEVVSNPEFLREGRAIHDFFHPDKVVIGTEDEKAREVLKQIYRPLYLLNTPFIFGNYETAELVKYANNAFLATKITFINQVANLCDETGADNQCHCQSHGNGWTNQS